MFALMTKDEIDHYNRRMILFSFIFLVAAFCFTKLFGSVGFIMANCLNMVIRIIHRYVELLFLIELHNFASILHYTSNKLTMAHNFFIAFQWEFVYSFTRL